MRSPDISLFVEPASSFWSPLAMNCFLIAANFASFAELLVPLLFKGSVFALTERLPTLSLFVRAPFLGDLSVVTRGTGGGERVGSGSFPSNLSVLKFGVKWCDCRDD